MARELYSPAAFSHYSLSLYLSFSRLSCAFAKSVLLVRNGVLSYARAYPRRITTVASVVWSVAPVWNKFFFFFLKTQMRALHRCTCYESLDAPAAELRIKLRSSLENAASLVPPRVLQPHRGWKKYGEICTPSFSRNVISLSAFYPVQEWVKFSSIII